MPAPALVVYQGLSAKKLALISHKKVANRIDAFVVLVAGDGQHPSVGDLGPQLWGPFFMHHAEIELAP